MQRVNLVEQNADAPQIEIYNRIWLSIAERKLKPGTRLKEEQLAEIFSMSRARVRQALSALEHDGLVTLVPNRGAFHLLIGELAGSPYLWDVLRDLLSRTALIIVMYQTRSQTDCGPDEHAEIVEAIAKGDADRARHLMNHHIDHLEGQLDLEEEQQEPSDLRDLLT